METFTIYYNDIKNGRIDPNYYRPEFRSIDDKIKKSFHKSISQICEPLKNGSTPSGGSFLSHGIPYFRSQDFSLFDFRFRQYISESFHKKMKRSLIKGGDILVAVVGATLGVVGIVPSSLKEGNINQNISRLRVKDNNVLPEYLANFLHSSIGQKMLLRNATITTQAYLNNSQLGKILVPIPPLPIQTEIVNLMDAAYAEKQAKEQKAADLLASIDTYVLERLGITLPEEKEEKVFTVYVEEITSDRMDCFYYLPKFKRYIQALEDSSFEVVSFGSLIGKLVGGETPNRKKQENYTKDKSKGIPFLRVQNITQYGLELTNVKYITKEVHNSRLKRSQLKYNDFVFTITGRLGSACLIPPNFEANINQHSVKVDIKNKNNINLPYLVNYLNTKFFNDFCFKFSTGGTRPALDYKAIRKLPIVIPPLTIQTEIANEVQARIDKAEYLKKSALAALEQAKTEVEKRLFGENPQKTFV